MSDPVLPGEGPDPMTDEALAEAQAFVDGNHLTGLGGPAVVDLVRRLLAEVKRRRSNVVGLIDASGGAWAEAARVTRGLRAELDAARSECAALTAKAEAAEAKAAEWDLTDEQIDMIADDVSPLRRAEKWLKLTSYRVCAKALRSALAEAAPGAPHTPAQEAP